MCFIVKSKTRWKFNIFPKIVYKFVIKIDDKNCKSFYYQEKYKLNELKKVPFKKIKLYKESSVLYMNNGRCLTTDTYSIGLHYYTSLTQCVVESCFVHSPTYEPMIVKCIIPPFSFRKENPARVGITNKLKIVEYETI